MFSALFSFLGGSVFRMIWGEVASFLTSKQDHSHELERLRLQADGEAAQHARSLESIKLQSSLGVETIRVQAEADIGSLEADGWANAVKQSMQPIGVPWVDAWNGIIRPLAASICLLLWVFALNAQGWKLTEWDMQLVGVVLGFFFASRELTKRGK